MTEETPAEGRAITRRSRWPSEAFCACQVLAFLPCEYPSAEEEENEADSPQVIEHYRNLWNFVRVIHEKEEDGSSICNPNSCPRMSAGQYVHSACFLHRVLGR